MTEPPADAPSVVFLMGPTASGKSALALALAERFDMEIVSVDSALVYRGLDIGTAKPNPAVRARVPHHLIDVCDPAEAYSAARFREDALRAIAEVRSRGRVPLLTGGTGLYFRALEQGLTDLPEADAGVRAALAAELARDGAPGLHARLARVDPAAAARIHPNDPQRVMRALEVHALTGRPLTALWAERGAPGLPGGAVKLVLAPVTRTALHERIARRFAVMLEQGLLNEVRRLRERGDLSADHPAMRTVGYREAWRCLDGEFPIAELARRGIVATRRLARRQLTWLRREASCTWLAGDGPRLVDEAALTLENSTIFKGSANHLK